MDCPTPSPLSNAAFLDAVHRRALNERIPLSGSLDLTQRCNFACIHCYCGDRSAGAPRVANGADELTAGELGDLFDQLADAGCLSLLLTGGDPLLRRDFEDIYSRAKSCGFLLNVFTNGTSIRPPVTDLLRELPPRVVEITLYGASEETYRRVTGVEGAYRRCREGIEALLAARVKVRLKTVLMQPNLGDFDSMRRMAAEYGIPFRFDAAISGRVGGDLSPITLRVPPNVTVDKEMADETLAAAWREWAATERSSGDETRLFNCGAGRTSFHIDFDATLRVCMGSRFVGHDLRRERFGEAWQRLGAEVANLKAPDGFACNACGIKKYCSWCPVFSELEGSKGSGSSPYLCQTARERAARLSVNQIREARHDGGIEEDSECIHLTAVAQA